MFQGIRSTRLPIDRALEGLPADYHTIGHGEERVVVGPTGAFVLTLPAPDVESAARRVADAARAIRVYLAAALSWAPFVDALVVVEESGGRLGSVGIVPGRLVTRMITDGPRMLDDLLIARISAEIGRHAAQDAGH
jgi:hypothetical protein